MRPRPRACRGTSRAGRVPHAPVYVAPWRSKAWCGAMTANRTQNHQPVLNAFVGMVGRSLWQDRLAALRPASATGRAGRAAQQAHAIELAIERLRGPAAGLTAAETCIVGLAARALQLDKQLSESGRSRWREALQAALCGPNTLVPAFHMLRVAALESSCQPRELCGHEQFPFLGGLVGVSDERLIPTSATDDRARR